MKTGRDILYADEMWCEKVIENDEMWNDEYLNTT